MANKGKTETTEIANTVLPKGAILSDYTIYKKLSAGGFSVVYLGYHKDGYPVAIKEFFPSFLKLRPSGTEIVFESAKEKVKFSSGLQDFKKEMELIMKLKHRNIIQIIDFFEMNGTAYIVMPYEYGMTMSKYISQNRNPNEAEIIKILHDIFSAIELCHESNIIHLDLKPGNIWLRPDGEPLILDFGTARIVDELIKNDSPPMHTPGYAAPEQHKLYFNKYHIGYWTDYYALGAIIYALIEHKTPESSSDLKEKGQRLEVSKNRFGQFNRTLLEVAEALTSTELDRRKKIALKDIIYKLSKAKELNRMDYMANIFY